VEPDPVESDDPLTFLSLLLEPVRAFDEPRLSVR
jgi:hypothetical protein